MKKRTLFMFALLLLFLVGVIPIGAQDYKKCVLIETAQGEKFEYYISSNPRLSQNNDKVTLTSDASTLEFNTESIKKVYVSEANYKLTYLLNGEVYKTYYHHAGMKIPPEPFPIRPGSVFSGWTNEPTTMPSMDVEVKGTFTVQTFKLTYMVDGVEYKSYNVEYGASITPETAPEKEGYTFSGWIDNIPQTMPANDVTIRGYFTVNKYNLVYYVDGYEYRSFEIEYGATITPLSEPEKEGYTFSGWDEVPTTMPANDVTVNGSFTINKYKLTYLVDEEVYKSYELEYGQTITPEAEPTKQGYLFSGWSEIPSTMPAHDVTVRGTFSEGRFNLIYMIDGEVYKTINYNYGDDITPEPAPEKEGYTFSGWSYIPSKMPAEDVVVTGSFTINKYKLTYMVDDVEYKSYDVEYGTSITPEAEPHKEGCSFSGWSSIPSTMPAHDVVVKGSFTVNKYKLIYKVDNDVYAMYELEYGASITPEDEPQKEGYTFSGWSWIPQKMPAEDVTIIGTFTVNKYTVTYIIEDNVFYTEHVEFGAKIVPPSAPEREGYDFAWGDYPETMPAKDISIIGKYTEASGINSILVRQGVYGTGEEFLAISGILPGGDVIVYNLSGEKVQSYKASADGEVVIALSALPKGVYFIKTKSQTFKVTRK